MSEHIPPKFCQIHLANMEHGLARVLAVLALSPQRVSELTGIQFDTAYEEGLDYFRAALLVTPEGKQFSLRQHHRSPHQGRTELVGSERSPDPVADLMQFMEALQISTEHLAWCPSVLAGGFRQLPASEGKAWPWRLLAVLALLPRHITDATGIVFEAQDARGQEDLSALVICTERGMQSLLRHRPPPLARIELLGPESSCDPKGDLEAFLAVTKISRVYLSWSIDKKCE
jgi:hypothetical protein